MDLSADMLKQAADKNLYRSLTQVEAGDRLGHVPGTYTVICAIGVPPFSWDYNMCCDSRLWLSPVFRS